MNDMKKETMRMWLESWTVRGYYENKQNARGKIPEGCKIPSKKDWEELLEATQYSFDFLKNVGVFTFPNGEKLRLPTNGFMGKSDGTVWGEGEEGYYLVSVSSSKTEVVVITESSAKIIKIPAGSYVSIQCMPTK